MNHYRPFVPCRPLLPVVFLICRYFHWTLFFISFPYLSLFVLTYTYIFYLTLCVTILFLFVSYVYYCFPYLSLFVLICHYVLFLFCFLLICLYFSITLFHQFSLFVLICSYLYLYFLICHCLSLFCFCLFLNCTIVFLVCPYSYLFVTICMCLFVFPPYFSLFVPYVLILHWLNLDRSNQYYEQGGVYGICKGLCTYADFQKRILHWTVVRLGFGSSIHENELNSKIVVSNRS